MEEDDSDRISKIMILDRGRVLLLMSPKLKKFTLPGGKVKVNETFTQGVRREVKEETGLNVSWCKIVFSKPNFVLFRGAVHAGKIKLSDEHDGYIFANINDVHKYPLCNYTKRDLSGLQRWWRNRHKTKKSVETPEN